MKNIILITLFFIMAGCAKEEKSVFTPYPLQACERKTISWVETNREGTLIIFNFTDGSKLSINAYKYAPTISYKERYEIKGN